MKIKKSFLFFIPFSLFRCCVVRKFNIFIQFYIFIVGKKLVFSFFISNLFLYILLFLFFHVNASLCLDRFPFVSYTSFFREKSRHRTFSSKDLIDSSFYLRVLYHKEICVFKSDILITVEGGVLPSFWFF